uniref:Pyruvate dehydrogenase phosphatase regulatory subunit n=1 Tax=Jaculus jaculus TaxID=51337 RepID=A0A8C5L137_JACJA
MLYRLLSVVGRQRTSPGWQNWSSARSSTSAAEAHPIALPAQAQVVICGGGVMGTSVAYHLSKMGWKDIVLLEQGRLAAGSTRFCAGILSTARHLSIEQKMADYSNKLYHQLEQETGIQTGYIRTGSISLAQTQDRLISLKRIHSRLNVIGIPSEIISPKKVAELQPLLNVHDLVGAMHVPEDAVVSSADVALALASAASQNGVQIYDRTSVLHVLIKKGQVTGVETDKGQIECQYFVNCAGQWAYELGLSSEEPVSIPLHACEHFYLLTRPWETPLQSNTPTIVDADGRIYIRNWQGGILSGGFEKNPKPIFTEGKNQLEIQNLREDWDHFEPLLSSLLRRMPKLETLEIMKLVNCPETFTPDMRCIMGESPVVQGYFVLAGMNSAGLSFALMYDLKVPRWDFQTGRQLRTSPLYDRLDAQGARWMEKHGFERPKYFSTGDQALEFLQYLFSNDLDVPVGHIVHTGMLNEGGGYENDCSIARLNKRSRPFSLVELFPQRSRYHLVFLAALNLIGPRAVDVLSELSYAPMTPDHFPTLFCKEMSVGYANGIRVMSMTHTGEPGFMLYIPIEYALHVYNEVMSVGQKYGIRNAGYYALRSLRIEKFFAFWGQDLNTLTTPLECGGESRVKLDKGIDFLGRDALLEQKQNGVYKRLAMFILDDHDTDLDLWPWWGEPIYRNGQYVGKTTSSAYSYTLERHVCLGFVHNFSEDSGEEQVVTADFINRGEYEIDIAGQRFQAKAKLYPVPSLFSHKRRKDDVELSDFHGK